MRPVLIIALILVVLALFLSSLHGAEPRPPQAPGLAVLPPLDPCNCLITDKCKCPPGTCDCGEEVPIRYERNPNWDKNLSVAVLHNRNVPDLPELAKAAFWDAAAWEIARKQTLPVCIWIGQDPKQVYGFLHFRGFNVAGFHAPVGVLIDRPVDGQLVVLAKLIGHPSAETILSYRNVQNQATDSSEGDDVACGKRRGGGHQGRGLFRGGRRGGC